MPVQWTRGLELGVPELDRQHLQIDEYLAVLHQAFCEGVPPDLAAVLAGVRDVAGQHFQAELRRMDEIQYPEKERHVGEHRRFSEELAGFEARCREGTSTALAMEVANWLAAWIREHQRWDLGLRAGAPRP